MRVVDIVVCCDLDCWDFNSFCLERGIEGLKDHLVVCMSKDIALSNEKSTTASLATVLSEQKANYLLFEQKSTGQLVFIPKLGHLSIRDNLHYYGMQAEEFDPKPLDIDIFIDELQNEPRRQQRVNRAKEKEIQRREQIILQQGGRVAKKDGLIPDYPMPLEDPFNHLINKPKAVANLFDIFDKNATVSRNFQLAGHGSNRQAITSLFLPNFHTALAILKELNVQLLFLDSCCTGGENSEHLYAQRISPATRNTDAWNDLKGERESAPFPVIISTIGNIFTYGTRSNAKQLFQLVTDKMQEKRVQALLDVKNKESIPKHITATEWNDILSAYEDKLNGSRKIRHLMQIMLPHSKFTLGSVQLLNPEGKFLIINAIEVSKAILRAKFKQPRGKQLRHASSVPETSPLNPFILFQSELSKVEDETCKIVVGEDIQLISLRITHVPATLRLESTLEKAPAICSSVPGVQHHYFKGLETPNMSLNDCWRAIHSYNQHDDAFRELLTEKAYFFEKLIAKDITVDDVLMYPVENDEKDSVIKNFDRVCYKKEGQYYIRQLKKTDENYFTKGIPATFRATYEEHPCTELQYMLELLATLVRTKPQSVMRVVAATEESDASFKAIFKTIDNSCYAPILRYIHKNYERELALIPQGVGLFLAKLPGQMKKDLVRLSVIKGGSEKTGVQDLLGFKDAPAPVVMEVGRPNINKPS